MDVSLQVGPNDFYFFERQPSVYGENISEKNVESSETKRKKEDDIPPLDFMIRDVSIQTTTGEVSRYEVSPSAEQIQKLFAKKIMPYYLTVEKKARQKALKMIYNITPPPVLRSFKTQTSENDFEHHITPSKDKKPKSVSSPDMKARPSRFRITKDPASKKSTIQQAFSKKVFFKQVGVSHKNVSIQVDFGDFYKPAKAEKRRKEAEDCQVKPTTEDTKDDSADIKVAEHDIAESVTEICLETKVLEDLKRFLLEKEVWDVAFGNRRVSKTEKDIFNDNTISVSDRQDKYLKGDKYSTSQSVDSFVAELKRTFSTMSQDVLMHFTEQIQIRDIAMKLYWQLMTPKNHQEELKDPKRNSTKLTILEEKESIVKSSDIYEKLISYEKMGMVGQYVDDIKKLMKRIDSIHSSSERNVARKTLSNRLLDSIQVFQEKLYDNVSKVTKPLNVKYLTDNNRNYAEELLDHDSVIYKYSELDEIIPNLWIGDFSVFKTPRKLKNIRYRIILGDCKKCITDQHETCIAKCRPFIYTPPFYTVQDNIHCMGIQAVDDASFPIFEYFRSTSDYIDTCLSDSGVKNVAVISKSGKSRCTAIVIAYLMIKKAYTLNEAVQVLKQKRAIRPNLGFMIQLIQLEQKLRGRRKRPDIRQKNVFAIRKNPQLDSYWLREEQTVTKPTKSFIFLDDRMSRPDRRLGVNTNLFLHSPFSAPGPHFYKDIENSTIRTSLFEMLPFYELDIASTSCEYKYPVVEGRVLASFSC